MHGNDGMVSWIVLTFFLLPINILWYPLSMLFLLRSLRVAIWLVRERSGLRAGMLPYYRLERQGRYFIISMFGVDVMIEKDKKYLNALREDTASFSSFFPAGGVPVRLLAPLSSPPRTRLPPGPRFLRPLLLREPNMLDGPKEAGWLSVRDVLRRRRSSLPTLLEAKSGGGAWLR